MKKGIAVACAVAVVAVSGAFVVNKVVNDKPEDETTTPVYNEYDDNDFEYTDYDDETEPSVQKPTVEQTTEADIMSVENILNEIKYFPYGTAGSSAKGVKIAVDMINFAENSDAGDDKISDEFNAFKRNMSDARYEEYLDNLYAVDEYINDLYNGENKDFTDSLGYKIQTEDGKFSLDKAQHLFELLGGE